MLTKTQKSEFVHALEDAHLGAITEDDVIETRDTISDFVSHLGEPHDKHDCNGLTVLAWHAVKTKYHVPGHPRRDLFVADFGDARAAHTF